MRGGGAQAWHREGSLRRARNYCCLPRACASSLPVLASRMRNLLAPWDIMVLSCGVWCGVL